MKIRRIMNVEAWMWCAGSCGMCCWVFFFGGVSTHVSFTTTSPISPMILFLLMNVHKRSSSSPSLCEEGETWDRTTRWAVALEHSWLGEWYEQRHDTDICAQHPTCEDTTFNGLKNLQWSLSSIVSALRGVAEKKQTKKTLFQSSSLAWSSRGAVRNVLNGRSMRRLVGKWLFLLTSAYRRVPPHPTPPPSLSRPYNCTI